MNIQTIADAFSIMTIVACFILKIPQILSLLTLKSAKGISKLGLMLELTSYTVMTCYNYTNDYALLSYLEYPVILIQEFVLIYLVMKYLNRINIMTISLALCYFIISICLIKQIIPNVFLTILASMCTPISALSKIVQLFAIIRAKNSESVSLLTWIISVFTNISKSSL
ncbi:hypothetical protein PV327_011034 [Microctonus hyperodae]|uniref:PQ-loop repeat-containing protein 3 n=1 Tax=Microctonus hyperodae TaxID=165561 RepID=A0AA39KUJ1_MICHY|nr:hypothetical protein PV327_011034 [Microctonus hyperodae]